MKKLSLLISTLALFLCFAFSVNAAGENAQTAVNINLNQSLNIEFNDDVYEYYLKFTPTKTGWYEINLDNFVADNTYVTTYDSFGEYVGFEGWNEFNNRCYDVVELTAYNTYYFEISCYEYATITATVTEHSHKFQQDYILEADTYSDGYIYYECPECEATQKITIPKVLVSLSKDKFTYNGKTQRPSVFVKDTAGKTFKEGTDYTVTYPKTSVNSDSYELTVVMKNSKYNVSEDKYYYINPKLLNKKDVKLSKTTVTFGEKPTVKISGLKKDKDFDYYDYELTYYSAGKHSFTVYGIGNYTGSVTVSFNVVPKKVSSLKVSKQTTTSLKLSWKGDSTYATDYYQIYDISKKKVIATVKSSETSYTIKKLKAGKKYSYKVRGYAKENGEKYYGEWKTIETSTLPKSTTLSSVKSDKKKTLTVKWKKQTAATGYQVQYSTNSKFKKSASKTVTIKKNKQTSSKISKLKSGKKYYVKVRTYKTLKINGKSTKVYSAWSSVKSAKVK